MRRFPLPFCLYTPPRVSLSSLSGFLSLIFIVQAPFNVPLVSSFWFTYQIPGFPISSPIGFAGLSSPVGFSVQFTYQCRHPFVILNFCHFLLGFSIFNRVHSIVGQELLKFVFFSSSFVYQQCYYPGLHYCLLS